MRFFGMIPGVRTIRPNLSYYDSNSGLKPGYESKTSRRALGQTYAKLPAYGYKFDMNGVKQFYAFSFDTQLVNSFEINAWEEI